MCKSGIPLKDVKSSEWNYSGIYKITNIVNSQEELEDRVKHYFENDRFQQKNQKF